MPYQVQIDDEVRDATSNEIAFLEALETEAAAKAKSEADQKKLKTETLAKLGLTADEVAALLS